MDGKFVQENFDTATPTCNEGPKPDDRQNDGRSEHSPNYPTVPVNKKSN